jgi:hypothetical protein
MAGPVMTVRVALLATVAAGLAMMVGLFVADLEGGPGIIDTPVYRLYGEKITQGSIPYRDFGVEYPPGSLVPFVIPALLSSTPSGYDFAFQTLMIFALAAASVLVVLSLDALGASTGRVALSLGAFWAGMALLGPFLMTRFDIFAAAVALGAVCAILHRRWVLGPVLLGLAIATKIYPAVLLPLLVARAAREGGRAEALRSAVICLGTALLVYLPFVLLAPAGVGHSIWRQVGRPLQIESLGASVLLALHHAFGMGLGWASGSGSQNLSGTVATVASVASALLSAAALVLVWLRFARGDSGNAQFARYAAAAVVAFVAFGKVTSPQFLAWLLAAVVLVPGRRGLLAMGLLVSACGVTRLWFPRTYWALVKDFDPTSSWLVLLRDLLLVAVFVTLIGLRRGEASASPLPVSTAREPEPV